MTDDASRPEPTGQGAGEHDAGGQEPAGRNPAAHDPAGHDPAGHDPAGHDTGGHDTGGRDTQVWRSPVPALLEEMNRDHLDPGYAAAAKRKAAAPAHPPDPSGRRRSVLLAVAVLLVAGVLFGVSAVNKETNQPRADKARAALLEDIDRAQERQSELASSAAGLADTLRSTQAELGAGGPLQTVSALENAGQVTPVTGPGLRIVINEAAADGAGGRGVIRDRDIQLLVNDLWASGAEAVAIGGVRVQPRSAIRQAGGSILVDNKPVFWPITIDAVGDPTGMQVKAVGLPGFGRFSSFAQLYDIEFDVSTQQDLNLPGGTGGALLYASVPDEATTTQATTTQATTTGATGTQSTATSPAGVAETTPPASGARESAGQTARPSTAPTG